MRVCEVRKMYKMHSSWRRELRHLYYWKIKMSVCCTFYFFHTFISSWTYIYQILKLADIQKSHVHQSRPISFYFAICTDIACFIFWHSGLFQQALQKVVKTAGKIIGTSLPEISTIYTTRCLRHTHNILRYQHRPAHHLFHLLPSGRRYRLIRARTARLAHSLYPQAVRLLNKHFWSRAMPAWRGSKRYLVVMWFRCYMAMTMKFWILNLLTYVTIFTLRFSRWHLPAGSAGHMTASALSKVSSVHMRHKRLFSAVASQVEKCITPSARVHRCKVAQNVPRVCINNSKMDTSNMHMKQPLLQ